MEKGLEYFPYVHSLDEAKPGGVNVEAGAEPEGEELVTLALIKVLLSAVTFRSLYWT